jgi:hypothetical protein
MLPPDSYELPIVESLVRRYRLDHAAVPGENHLLLPLALSYDEFLQKLGPRTRRNFRYYRRKLEAEGHSYVRDVPMADFQSAAETLLAQKVVGANPIGAARAFAMLARAKRPILAGLRHKDGSWLSLLGGWFEASRPIIFFQINSDKHHSKASLCLVLRGYLFEQLIDLGVRSVIFWAGVGEPLNRYSKPIPGLSVYLDKPGKLWSGFRRMVAHGVRKLPPHMAWRAEWIVPNSQIAAPATVCGVSLEID